MSGHDEQSSQNQNQNQNPDDADLMMLASVALPMRSQNLLDYIYGNRIALVPLRVGGGAFGDGFHDMEPSAASILARSLYDRCPVKRVISEEEHGQLVEKKFTSSMVEELKINGACGIWQVDFEEGDDIMILPCNHAFNAEAITKWLKEEKAECPICRFSFKSKEVVEREDEEGERDGDEDEDAPAPVPAPAPAPADAHQESDIVRVNNIASRIAEHVNGQAHQHHHHHLHHHHHHSVSVPMNQLLRNVRMMSSSARPQEPARAAVPSSSGAALPPSHAPVGQEARAEAVERDDVPPAHINAFNPNILNILNNINLRNIDINGLINNRFIINQNIYPDIDNQEQADIEEAIRRSLE